MYKVDLYNRTITGSQDALFPAGRTPEIYKWNAGL
jgi:hypothetical protein